ncbi:MAG: PAS domain S-box protein [Burkholderiales bacterium RIFCSPLOWO2_02_FULL_57_36]|nr:MAG: PAS domain S-box protein [Burkholderiales bacterium RIFCSPLOWO2_02_FULL_57_36]
MKISTLQAKEVITGREIFRVASLFLYITLLLQVVLATYARGLVPTDISIAAIALLTALFLMALARYVWPGFLENRQHRILFELACAASVIAILTLQRTMPTLPLPWLIGAAGVFPLVLRGGTALLAIITIALIGFMLNSNLGVPLGDWLPSIFATLFVGLLAILLSKALNSNLAAVGQALVNERRFDAIARATRQVFIITDDKYNVKYVNPAIHEVLGYSQSEIEMEGVQPVVHPDDLEDHQNKLRYLRNSSSRRIFSRLRMQHKNGHWVWLETSGYNLLHDHAINGLVFSTEDITLRKDAELRLEQEHALLRAVLDLNPSMIYAKDTEGRFTISNLSFQQRFGYSSEEELRGKTSHEAFMSQTPECNQKDVYEMANLLHLQDMQVMQSGEPLEDLDLQGLWEQDSRRWYRMNKYPLRDANGVVSGLLGITRDVTDRKEYELRLEHQALHDPLTALPNRRYLLRTIASYIDDTPTKPAQLVTLFCDLDFFKSVNDTHGHDVGDKCLLEITRRIVAELPKSDFVARFGGDEFIILANATLPEANEKAAELLQALSFPVVVGDVVVKIQASIGIALLTADHKTPSELIRDADAAMYQAKERGRNRAEIFNASLQSGTTKRAQMDVALRFALERDELHLVFQPKVSMLDGTVKGFELLLRWNSPQYGQIMPSEFIPIAETSGLVMPIGLWALEQACKKLGEWQAQYPDAADLTVAVNVSMRQLLQPSFLSDVSAILKRTRVLPRSIELELTETAVMANPVQTIENLSMLKKLGVRLALDDFGTGYSSLAYLQKLPIDVLKIDKAFVHGLGRNKGDAEIVRLILALAKTLNLETVAEGVESIEQLLELKKLGCHLGQGYIFSPAITPEEVEAMLFASRQFQVA